MWTSKRNFHASNARGVYPQSPAAICLKMPVKNAPLKLHALIQLPGETKLICVAEQADTQGRQKG